MSRASRSWLGLLLSFLVAKPAFAEDPFPADPFPNGVPAPGTTKFPGGAPKAEAPPRFGNDARYNNGNALRQNARRSLATDLGTGINQSEAANVTQAAPTPDATSWWAPHLYKYFVGYEGTIGGATLLANNAVAFGYWMTPHWGVELYLGYSRSAGTYTEATSTAVDVVANTQAVTTTYTGTQTVPQITFGFAPKYRFYQNDWVQIALGVVAAVVPKNSSSYMTGTRVVASANLDTPENSTVTETTFGNVTQSQDWTLQTGPRLNAEFYLKWFPHLALGLETGVMATFGGYVTTTTNARTRSYAVVNGAEQPPTADSSTVTQSTPKPGYRASTFGLGGGTFSFTGTFTIRYVW